MSRHLPQDWAARAHAPAASFLEDVREGLNRFPKSLPCRWLYDDMGSRLFEAIMGLPEYYPTRCEAQALGMHAGDILRAMGRSAFRVVDLGAGNGAKAGILLKRFQLAGAITGYSPVDISLEALSSLARIMSRQLPELHVDPVEDDWLSALGRPDALPPGRKLVLYLGSNIGNHDATAAHAFLSSLRRCLEADDALLIGFDMRKHPMTILKAYSDSEGITSRFNFNLLDRINRELGGGFRKGDFCHRAEYHALRGEARSYLVARRPLSVPIDALGQTVSFRAGEGIHTESSFKYSPRQIETMAREAGFEVRGNFQDSTGSFVDSLWFPKRL